MSGLSHSEITLFLLSLGVLLGLARLLGEAARRFRQPAVLGELMAGILLGPTVLGHISPQINQWLFPMDGPIALARSGLVLVAVVLFLLVAGLEVDLSTAFRQGKAAFYVSLSGMLIPFGFGFAVAWFAPSLLMAVPEGRELVFALFFGVAMCISALPVIAKILMDLNLLKTDMGVIIIASAIIDDLAGWMCFAMVLGMMNAPTAGGDGGGHPVLMVILLTLAFAGFMLTVGRWAIHRILPWLQAHLSWPAGVLGFAITFALLSAALTEWIGIHAIFGSFIFGIALGDSRHLRERTRATLEQFISTIFAPLFFASIGLKLNFIDNFALVPVVVVLLIATAGKVLGCSAGALMAGMNKQEAWAVGFGMNARGAMEIVLGLLALQHGVIDEKMFIALVVMALGTSITSGTAMQFLLRRQKTVVWEDFINPRGFSASLKAKTREEAISELSRLLASGSSVGAGLVEKAVLEREASMPTGLPNMIAIPHARLESLASPLIAVGISKDGVDFDAADGSKSHLIFMILTPQRDEGAQLQILAGIAGIASDTAFVKLLSESAGYTEFLAALRMRRFSPDEVGHATA